MPQAVLLSKATPQPEIERPNSNDVAWQDSVAGLKIFADFLVKIHSGLSGMRLHGNTIRLACRLEVPPPTLHLRAQRHIAQLEPFLKDHIVDHRV